jgi:hypothetical protein
MRKSGDVMTMFQLDSEFVEVTLQTHLKIQCQLEHRL